MTKNKMLVGVLSTSLVLVSILGSIPSHATDLFNDQSVLVDVKTLISKQAIEDKNKKILNKYENATSLTDSQLVELLKAVGFKGKSLQIAWAISKTESNGRPFAFNGNAKTGDSSYGIFQVNMLGMLGPDRRDKFNLDFNAELFSPVKNAQIVYYMTDDGTDWSSWSSYTSGAYKKWLNKFPN